MVRLNERLVRTVNPNPESAVHNGHAEPSSSVSECRDPVNQSETRDCRLQDCIIQQFSGAKMLKMYVGTIGRAREATKSKPRSWTPNASEEYTSTLVYEIGLTYTVFAFQNLVAQRFERFSVRIICIFKK